MNCERVRTSLTTRRFGRELHHRDEVDSTNRWAADAVRREPIADGAVFVAERQTRGRGTAGNRWHSDDPGGLYHSLVVLAPIPAAMQPLSFAPAVALADLLGAAGVPAHLKWPNDVLVGARKIAGILIESQRRPDGGDAWVVGVGVNVNQERFADELANRATSLRLETGGAFAREDVLADYLNRFEALYDGGAPVVDLWRARSRMLGARLRVTRAGVAAAVTALDLTDAGHLVVVTDAGRREEWVASTDLDIDPAF